MGKFQHYGIFPTSKSAFKRILINPKYMGKFRDNPNFCEPIIDEGLFNDVQRKLTINIKCDQKRIYIFTGLIICPMCGNKLSSLHRSNKAGKNVSQNMYRCKRHYGSKVKTCDFKKAINEKKLEEYLLNNIKTLMNDYIISIDVVPSEKKDHSSRIAYLNRKARKLKELYINDLISIDEYKCDKQDIESELESLKSAEEKPMDLSLYKQFEGLDISAVYADLSQEEKRAFWRSIIKEIHLDEIATRLHHIFIHKGAEQLPAELASAAFFCAGQTDLHPFHRLSIAGDSIAHRPFPDN